MFLQSPAHDTASHPIRSWVSPSLSLVHPLPHLFVLTLTSSEVPSPISNVDELTATHPHGICSIHFDATKIFTASRYRLTALRPLQHRLTTYTRASDLLDVRYVLLGVRAWCFKRAYLCLYLYPTEGAVTLLAPPN